MGNKGNITLAIETAVTGGSLALVKEGRKIDLRIGGEGVSRSEDLLLSISDLLARNSVDRSELITVAVSTGPGSYTGIRVGIATALGLKNALGIECVGIQVLEAMAATFEMEESVAAIPVGRGDICWQLFGSAGAGEILIDRADGFAAYLLAHTGINAIVHDKVFGQIAGHTGLDPSTLTNAGEGLAGYLGLAAQRREAVNDLTPIYVRDFV
jgi:tRNA threonylcarbamoyl adenosine modification protein YeaZ